MKGMIPQYVSASLGLLLAPLGSAWLGSLWQDCQNLVQKLWIPFSFWKIKKWFDKVLWIYKNVDGWLWRSPTMDAQWSLFFIEIQNFWAGQTNWADKFWGIWGIFGWTISIHFGTVIPLFIFSIIPTIFLQKTKPLYPHININIWN